MVLLSYILNIIFGWIIIYQFLISKKTLEKEEKETPEKKKKKASYRQRQ